MWLVFCPYSICHYRPLSPQVFSRRFLLDVPLTAWPEPPPCRSDWEDTGRGSAKLLWSVRQPWCTPNLPPMRGRRRGPFRVPYLTGNNGITQFYQSLVSELSFSVGFCEGHCPHFCKLCSLLVYMIYLSHLFFSLKNHTNHFFKSSVYFPSHFLFFVSWAS